MSQKNLIIKGAREHNLKNVDLTIPRDKFVVFTGISQPEAGTELRVEVKLRYLARPVAATAVFDGMGGARLLLDTPEKAVTPGQSAVMYRGDVLLCGGFIV